MWQTMGALTGTISALTLEELQKLPAYLEVMLSVPPKALVVSKDAESWILFVASGCWLGSISFVLFTGR
jgi:hypothetical protein